MGRATAWYSYAGPERLAPGLTTWTKTLSRLTIVVGRATCGDGIALAGQVAPGSAGLESFADAAFFAGETAAGNFYTGQLHSAVNVPFFAEAASCLAIMMVRTS